MESDAPAGASAPQPRVEEDAEIVEDQEDSHAVAAYYVEGADEDDHQHEIHFDSRLGLAVEAMQDGITLDLLWRVV